MAKFTDSIPGSILKVRLITIAFESSLVEMKTLSFLRPEVIRRSPSSICAFKVVRSWWANFRASSKRLLGICIDVFMFIYFNIWRDAKDNFVKGLDWLYAIFCFS